MTTADMRGDIAEVLVRYATGIDRRDWALFHTCFTKQCHADYADFGVWHSADEITAWMDEAHRHWGHTMHRISNIVVSGDEERATARSYVDAVLFQPDGKLGVHALGFYDDELLKTHDGWKIDRRQWTAVQITNAAAVDIPT